MADTSLAFVGGGVTPSGPSKGVYFDAGVPSPPPIKIADFATTIPGGAGNFTDFGAVAFDPDGAGGHVTAFIGLGTGGQQGIYAAQGNTLRKIVDLHDTLDGQKPVSFSLGAGGTVPES